MSARRSSLICLLALALSAGAASASQVVPVNLEQMSERAATVFAGRCLETRVEHDPRLGRDVSVTTFEVARVAKGADGSTVEVRMLAEGPEGATDSPGFEPGEEVVLFLYGKSDLGLSSPVGMGQGRFAVVTDKKGRRMAVNQFANRNLLRDLTPQGRSKIGGETLERWTDRRDLDPEALLDMVQSLFAVTP